MNNSAEKIRQWLPVCIIVMTAIVAVVKIQTVQAELYRQVDKKTDKTVYQTDRQNLTRELNRIHEQLKTLNGKIDALITIEHNPNPGRIRPESKIN